jgi:hypothetical protein
MASALFRFIGAVGRNVIVANTVGSFALLAVLVMGGFILSRGEVQLVRAVYYRRCIFFVSMYYNIKSSLNYVLMHQLM